MFLLFSGEGPSDLGVCDPAAGRCEGDSFKAGPMAIMVDQLVDSLQGYDFSHLDAELVEYVSESYLAENKPAAVKKSMALVGKKKPKETQYFYANARSLAIIAQEKSATLGQPVIAVLFRDSDGTASAARGLWQDKRDSMLAGFAAANFALGVAMVPKPKSEAWLLCGLKPNPYQHCEQLEDGSGNDKAPNSLKSQLAELLAGHTSAVELTELIKERRIDLNRLNMPSFASFKADLAHAIRTANQG